MVLGLKPMGKPSTKILYYKFWTEPRLCMVLGFKPMGKPSTKNFLLQVLDRTKALYGPRTQAYGETNYLKEINTSFGQNQGIVWSSDSNLWENQLPERKNKGSRHNLDIVWSSDSIPWRSYPLIVGLVPRLNGIPSLPSDPQYQGNWCDCDSSRCYQKHGQSPSLLGNPLGWFILSFLFLDGCLMRITEHSAVISVSLISLIYCGLALLYLIMSISSN